MCTNLDDLIMQISQKCTAIGYVYLKKAVEIVIQQGKYRQGKLMEELYPQVAKATGKTVCQVSRGIGRAAEDIWENGGGHILGEMLKKPQLDRSAPGETIYYIAYLVSDGAVKLE